MGKSKGRIARLLLDYRFHLALIFLLALILRLLGLLNIRLGGDFAYHWSVAGDIVNKGSFPLTGPSASINPAIHLAPFYYYLLSIPYLLSSGNFKAAIIFFSLINSLSIFPLYYVSNRWFGKKIAFKIIILYACSSYLITVQNFPWNPFLIPTLVILLLYLLEKIKEKRYHLLPLLFFLLSFGLSFHATFLFLIPLFFIFIPYKNISKRIIAVSILLFLVPLTTLFFVEVKNGLLLPKEIISVFSPSKESCNIFVWLRYHGHGESCFHYIRNTLFIFRLFSQGLFASSNLAVVGITLFITLLTLIKVKFKQKSFFLIWLGIIFLLFLTYSKNVYLHFFLILIPLPLFIFVLFLEKVKNIKRYGFLISRVLFLLTICWNIVSYIGSLSVIRK